MPKIELNRRPLDLAWDAWGTEVTPNATELLADKGNHEELTVAAPVPTVDWMPDLPAGLRRGGAR